MGNGSVMVHNPASKQPADLGTGACCIPSLDNKGVFQPRPKGRLFDIFTEMSFVGDKPGTSHRVRTT